MSGRRDRRRTGRTTRRITSWRRAPGGAPEIWVIDDDALVRKAMARVLAIAAPTCIIRVFAGVDEADAALARSVPVGLIIDERLGEDSGHVWALARRQVLRDTHIALCTAYVRPETSEFLYQGVDVVLIKPTTTEAIRLFVARATEPRPRTIRAAVVGWCKGRALTPTQTRVVELLGTGSSAGQIAARMGIALNTVRQHLNAVMKKAGVHGLPALLASILAYAHAAG